MSTLTTSISHSRLLSFLVRIFVGPGFFRKPNAKTRVKRLEVNINRYQGDLHTWCLRHPKLDSSDLVCQGLIAGLIKSIEAYEEMEKKENFYHHFLIFRLLCGKTPKYVLSAGGVRELTMNNHNEDWLEWFTKNQLSVKVA